MAHSVVLCLVEEGGCSARGISLWQTEQMPYTNKQPGGARAASPSILCCYINSKLLLRPAAAAAKTLCPYHSLLQPGRLLLYVCVKLLPLSPAALELHMIIFLVMGKGLLWICSSYLSTQRDYCQKLIQTFKLSCLCAVGCGGCNLNWLRKKCGQLVMSPFKAQTLSLFSTFPHRSHHTRPNVLRDPDFYFFISATPHMDVVCCLLQLFNCRVNPNFKPGHPHIHKTPRMHPVYPHLHTHTKWIPLQGMRWSLIIRIFLGSAKVHKGTLCFEIRRKQTFN